MQQELGTEAAAIVNEDLVSEFNRLAGAVAEASQQDADTQKTLERVLLNHAMTAVEEAERKIAEQAADIARLERMVMIDPLTEVLNRRGFEQELDRVLAASHRYQEQGVLIFIDLDAFKLVNDTHGHAAGDEMLRQVARFLEKNVRKSDYVGRIGGDEFAVLLIRISNEDALARAEVLNRRLNNAYISWRGRMIGVRASCGIQTFDGSEAATDLLERADRAMYRIKRSRAKTEPARATA